MASILFILRGWIFLLTFFEVEFQRLLTRAGQCSRFDQVLCGMDAFDIRRAELLHSTSDSRDWYLLNSKICGIPVGKFISSSPLVSSFPKEFNTVQLSNLKNGGHLDRRLVHKEEVFIASSFGVVSAILRQKLKAGEEKKYSWLVDGINSLNIGQDNEDCQTATDTRDNNKDKIHDPVQTVFGVDSRSAISIEDIEKSQDENLKLKAELEVMLYQLEALRDEVKNGGQSTLSSGTQDPDSTSDMWTLIGDVCDKFQVPLASLFADQVDQNVEVAGVMSDIAEQLLRKKKDPKQTLEAILGDSAPKFFQSLRVPDWTLLYFKLQSRIPDQGWQTLLNFTKLGRTKTKSDIPLLLNKNHIKAVRKMIFHVVKKAMGICPLPDGAPWGYQVNLSAAVAWAARETRLHQPDQQTLELNLKLDGRPFFGRQQVMIGVVPINVSHASSESCKSVYPIAIANCEENRINIEALIKEINAQKNAIKKNGITIDGRHFKVKFTVTLDYKALIMLIKRKSEDNESDEEMEGLCQRGLDTECCVFCKVIRGCACLGVERGESCAECFIKSKANVGGWKGVRDDLLFLLEEELCDVNLCTLHCELRNTEQLLCSLGMFAYECGSLKNCNAVLAKYGPDSMKGRDRIVVKTKPGQESGIERHNIQVLSFSGSTEHRFLENIEEIVTQSLPLENLRRFFKDKDVAETYLLNQITFCEEMIQVEVLA